MHLQRGHAAEGLCGREEKTTVWLQTATQCYAREGRQKKHAFHRKVKRVIHSDDTDTKLDNLFKYVCCCKAHIKMHDRVSEDIKGFPSSAVLTGDPAGVFAGVSFMQMQLKENQKTKLGSVEVEIPSTAFCCVTSAGSGILFVRFRCGM